MTLPASPSPKHFWLNRGTGAEGPYDEAAIALMIGSLGLKEANISEVGVDLWRPLASHPPFAQALRNAGGGGPSGARPATRTTSNSKPLLAVGLLLVLGGGGFVFCVGSYFVFQLVDSGPSVGVAASEPPPPIHESSGAITLNGRAHEVRLEVRTEPGAEVEFGDPGSRNALMPHEEMVADADGRAVFVPTALPPWVSERPIEIPVRVSTPGSYRRSEATITLQRPPYLRCTGTRCACRMGPTCTVEFANDAEVRVQAPPGSTAHVDGQEQAVTTAPVTFAVTPVLFDEEHISGAVHHRASVNRAYPVTLDLPGGGRIVGELAVTHSTLLGRISRMFSGVPQGTPADLPDAGRGRAILRIRNRGIDALYGQVHALSDIRYVSTTELVERESSCGRYQNQRTGATIRIRRTYTDARVQLWDVRTGRRGPRTTIRAGRVSCPRNTSTRRVRGRYRGADVTAWLQRRAS